MATMSLLEARREERGFTMLPVRSSLDGMDGGGLLGFVPNSKDPPHLEAAYCIIGHVGMQKRSVGD